MTGGGEDLDQVTPQVVGPSTGDLDRCHRSGAQPVGGEVDQLVLAGAAGGQLGVTTGGALDHDLLGATDPGRVFGYRRPLDDDPQPLEALPHDVGVHEVFGAVGGLGARPR